MSDTKIFEEGHYNALTRSTLGIFNWDDSCPTESIYYLFRCSIAKYASEGKSDLMEQMFSDSQKYRYLTQKDIEEQLLREKIANTPLEELRKRNNVEATIF